MPTRELLSGSVLKRLLRPVGDRDCEDVDRHRYERIVAYGRDQLDNSGFAENPTRLLVGRICHPAIAVDFCCDSIAHSLIHARKLRRSPKADRLDHGCIQPGPKRNGRMSSPLVSGSPRASGDQDGEFRNAWRKGRAVAAELTEVLQPVGQVRAAQPNPERATYTASRSRRDAVVDPPLIGVHPFVLDVGNSGHAKSVSLGPGLGASLVRAARHGKATARSRSSPTEATLDQSNT